MNDSPGLEPAREAAAHYLRSEGYGAEADLVLDGFGDDFRETRIALALWKILNVKPSPPLKRQGRRLAGEEC